MTPYTKAAELQDDSALPGPREVQKKLKKQTQSPCESLTHGGQGHGKVCGGAKSWGAIAPQADFGRPKVENRVRRRSRIESSAVKPGSRVFMSIPISSRDRSRRGRVRARFSSRPAQEADLRLFIARAADLQNKSARPALYSCKGLCHPADAATRLRSQLTVSRGRSPTVLVRNHRSKHSTYPRHRRENSRNPTRL